MNFDLVNRTPQTPIEQAEDWAHLSLEERKRRAAEAIRDGDASALASLFTSYLLTFSKTGLHVSSHTLASYQNGLSALLQFAEGTGRKIHQLTQDDSLRFARWLESQALKPGSVNVRLASARAFYRALRWAGMVESNPFDKISVRDPQRPEEKRQAYRDIEMESLLAIARPGERVALLLASDAGLRVSEVCRLRWDEIDFDAGELVVHQGKGRKDGRVKLTRRLVDALRSYGPNGSLSVVGGNVDQMRYMLKKLCRQAGIPWKTFHGLRHTAGTRMWRATHDLKLVARHLRHVNVATAAVYSHVDDTDYQEAMNAFEGGQG